MSRAVTTSWAYKHPYPRSLNLKAVLPQLQTLAILLAVGAAIIFAAPQDRAKARHLAHLRAQSADRIQLEDLHSASTIETRSAPQRAEPPHRDRFVGPFPLPRPPNQFSDAIADRAARTRSRRPGRERRVKQQKSYDVSNSAPSDSSIETAAFANVRGRRHHDNQIQFFTIAEVAERLQVATRTVRRWIKAGDLVVHRVGGVVRIAELDLRAFLALHREG